MFGHIPILLGEMDAEAIGRVVGTSLIPALIILFGVSKCHTISLRPSTNRKCALALMFALFALFGTYLLGAITKLLITSAHFHTINLLALTVTLGLSVTTLVLGIRGLVEYSKQPGQYDQGRAQASWALAISTLIILLAASGFVRGLLNSSAKNGPKQIPGEPGRILEFANYNFRFRAPDHPWVTVDLSSLNKDSKASFTRQFPETYFLIIPEIIGPKMTSAQLAELGKAHVRSAAASTQIIQETPFKVNNLDGILVELEAQVGQFPLFYVQWYMVTNGYAYQLIGYGKTEDRQRIEGELRQMLTRFELIDTKRIAASKASGFTTNFTSPSHYYTVDVTNSAWHEFSSLKENFPEAEFGGSQGDTCFAILPVWLGEQNVDLDALAAGLLDTMNITYPGDDFTHRKVQNEAGDSRLQFDYQRTIDETLYRYRIKIIHAGEFGYLAVAWTLRNEDSADAILNDALERIKISAPKAETLKSQLKFNNQDYKNQAYVLNQAGLVNFNSDEYEKALPLFQAAVAADRTNSAHINNLLLTLSRLNRPKEGLEFLDGQPKELLEKPEFITFKAYFQSKCSLTDEAITNYARAFSNGYRNEADFRDYINLLNAARQYDKALAEVGRYLQAGDSLTIRLLTAEIYQDKQDYGQAVKFLKVEHDKTPYNSKITRQLIDTLLDADMPNEALTYSRELVKDDKDSYIPYYLKSRCEINLKWYREAKVSLEVAAKLEPSDEDVKSSLNYVSGLLGEGNNLILKQPIDPVFLPENLTNRAITIPATNIARDFGAFYKQHIKALSYDTNTEYKITDYLLIHVLDAAGVAAFSTYQMAFDPLSDDIYVNDARVLNDSGKTISAVNSSDCYVIDETQDGKVSQRKTLNIPIAGLQPGCDVLLTITRRSSGHQEEFPFLDHSFSKSVPILISGVFLRGDGAGLKIRSTSGIQRENLKDGIYWSTTNPMVARLEPLQPPANTFLPMIWIADANWQWKKLASNYLASIKDRLQPDENVTIKAQQLINGVSGNSTKIAILSRFVQTNCTYKAIEFGRHSRIPQKASDTLHNSYGDCKDHSVLLKQLLSCAGIPANLALISSEDAVQTDLPSIDQFDHMIVEVQQDNREQFIDATDKGSDLSRGLPIGLAEHQALVLNPANPHFTKLSAYPSDASCIQVQQHAALLGTTDLSVDETISLTGVHAAYLREYLQNLSPTYRQESLQRDMGLTDAIVSHCEIESLENLDQPLQIRCSFIFKNRFHHTQNGLTGMMHGGFERYYLSTIPVSSRVTPFEITVPLQIYSQVVFDLPKGYHLVEKPEPDGKLDPRFVTFQSQHKLDAGKLGLTFQFQQLVGRHNASDYSSYLDAMKQVQSLMDNEIDLQVD